jgi:hypothetical protein
MPFTLYVAKAKAMNFDLILGQDFNIALGININNEQRCITWDDNICPFRVVPTRTNRFIEMQRQYMAAFSPTEEEDFQCSASFATEILAAKYEQYDVQQVAREQKHLLLAQRKNLKPF